MAALIRAMLIALFFSVLTGLPVLAGALSVTPVLVDVPAPGATSSITIRNQGDSPINIQIRIFRWTQEGGQDHFVATRDVVASPPFTTLAPGAENLVRVVRVAGSAPRAEESYRLIIDQLPDANPTAGAAVSLLLRHSIPVFFASGARGPMALDWSFQQIGQRSRVIARNQSNRRVRLSGLKASSADGASLSFGDGLVGYVLANATMQWFAPGTLKDARANGQVKISGQSDLGPLEQGAHVLGPQ